MSFLDFEESLFQPQKSALLSKRKAALHLLSAAQADLRLTIIDATKHRSDTQRSADSWGQEKEMNAHRHNPEGKEGRIVYGCVGTCNISPRIAWCEGWPANSADFFRPAFSYAQLGSCKLHWQNISFSNVLQNDTHMQLLSPELNHKLFQTNVTNISRSGLWIWHSSS